jgi:hypothetical protein
LNYQDLEAFFYAQLFRDDRTAQLLDQLAGAV